MQNGHERKALGDEPKKYYCGTRDCCQFKQHYINNRCFAQYAIRQSCPSLIRADHKTILQGSKEEKPLTK